MGTLRDDQGDLAAELGPTKQAFLNVIRSRADLGLHAFVNGRTVIGRHPSCTLPLHDFKVSGQHATITPSAEGDFVLEDLRSTNGTRVNGIPVVATKILQDGEKIFVGETVIQFSLADEIESSFHSEVATLVGTDPLTGLPSKRRFDEEMEFAFQSATRSNRSLAVLMMDMDGVKQINDSHGHIYGAHAIGAVGRIIASVLGSNNRACRYGGDEFCAFLPGHGLPMANAVGERIRQAVETADLEKNNIPLRPTISIGVACYPEAADELQGLVTIADAALYRAKAMGKNCVATHKTV
jgi:diguanylate cyclase (GGDEF)-like protein